MEPALPLPGQEQLAAVLIVSPYPHLLAVSVVEEARQGFVCWQVEDIFDHNQVRLTQSIRLKQPSRAIEGVDVKRCPSGYYVLPFHPCDDEKGGETTQETAKPQSPRRLPMFACADRQKQIDYSLVYDGLNDCIDGSDEVESLRVFGPLFRCKTSQQYLLQDDTCDGNPNCRDGSDEDPDLCVGDCRRGFFFCPGEGCLPQAVVNSGLIMCLSSYQTATNNGSLAAAYQEGRARSDGGLTRLDLDGYGLATLTDLEPGEDCPETHFRCPGGRCIPTFLLRNSIEYQNLDCPYPDMDDELTDFQCPGHYRCFDNHVCLHPDYVCDGVSQCFRKDDEMYCNLLCPNHCFCQGHAFTCSRMFDTSHQQFVRYLDLSGAYQPDLSAQNARRLVLLAFLNLSSCALYSSNRPNFTLRSLPIRVLDMSHNHLTDLHPLMFPDPYLTHLNLSNNPLVHVLQFVHFQTLFRLNNVKVFIVRNTGVQQIEPRAIGHWLQDAERLDIRGSSLTSFHVDTFFGLSRLHVLDTDDPRMCCLFFLRYKFSQTDCTAPRDELSSCSDLLRSSFFRTFLWTLSMLAVVGNAGVLAYGVCARKEGIHSGYRVFVSSLCVSDLLMGIYLSIVGSADAVFSGQFFKKYAEWTQSPLCHVAGFVALLSSEVSALLICLITLDRLLVLRFPLSFNLHMTARSALLASGAAWGLGLVLAILPALPLTADWEFYGQTAICIPLPITRQYFSGKDYTFGVFIVFNFMLFFLIAVGQVLIYRAIRSNSMRESTQSQQHDTAIARRLFLVVITDFCCWFPVGVMGLLAARGTPIPGEVNVGAAIFLLPLNSALNPFLYTLNTLLEKRRKRKLAERVNRMVHQLRVELGSWSAEKLREHLQAVEAALRKVEVRLRAETVVTPASSEPEPPAHQVVP